MKKRKLKHKKKYLVGVWEPNEKNPMPFELEFVSFKKAKRQRKKWNLMGGSTSIERIR